MELLQCPNRENNCQITSRPAESVAKALISDKKFQALVIFNYLYTKFESPWKSTLSRGV